MATAPTSSLRLTLRRVYRKPRSEVFRAWTDPKELKRWWGPPGVESPSVEVDLRVGGRYRFAMRKLPDGQPFFVTGIYREIVAGERLVFTWNWEGGGPPFGSNTFVTIEFHDAAAGTEIVLTHERFESDEARNKHIEGWNGCFESLEALL